MFALLKTPPEASVTPGTRWTFGSTVAGKAGVDPLSPAETASRGVMATSTFLVAVVKIESKDLLIVSVRM
jgi:hypothetical protein